MSDPAEPMLQFFEFSHLRPDLQAVSKPFCELAHNSIGNLPRNPERTVMLRKLLEAKDCAVRAFLYVPALAAAFFALGWLAWTFPTLAADLQLKAAPLYSGSPYNWSGFYFGGQVGGEFSARPITGVTTGSLEFLGDPGSLGPNAVGFAGGAHVGINYQTGGFVIGAELGGELSSMNSAGTFTADTMNAAAVVRKPWDAYLIGKAGLVLGPRGEFLFYGLGGAAVAELQNDVTITDILAPGALKASSSNVHTGWTAGAGLDWGTGPVVLGFRYRYSDYGTHGLSFDTGNGSFRADQSARDNQFTGRLSIKLN